MTKINILIVGQGLAGTLLSFELMKKNITHTIISDPKTKPSSLVAAGMYNPLVFKRLTKSWLIDDLMPVLEQTYHQLDGLLQNKLIHKKTIAKLINENEKEWWINQINKNNLENYFKGFHPNAKINGLKPTYQIAEINKSGYIDLKTLLNNYKKVFGKQISFVDEPFDYLQINFNDSTVEYKGKEYHKIIFCEGSSVSNNPFIPDNAFYLTKGDVIEAYIEGLSDQHVINKDCFILPKSKNKYLIGSTYKHTDIYLPAQESDAILLKNKAQQLIVPNIKILNHKVGIRPTTKDRRPIVGFHPKHKQIGVFNGLGTKGVMLAPYFAKLIANSIEFNQEIPIKEVRLERFFK